MALVVPFVFSEHGGVCKTFTTLSTEVWLFSGVRTHVHLQFRQGWVALRALTARVRAFSTVLCHMDPQAYSLHEGLSTLYAYKRFLPSVRAAVVSELCGCFVGFMTVWTRKGALGRVRPLML